VVGAVNDDEVGPFGVSTRHPQGELIGFTAGAQEVTDPQGLRQGGAEPFGILHEVGVEVAGIRIQDSHLLLRRPDDRGMAVPDMRDVVHGIEKLAT